MSTCGEVGSDVHALMKELAIRRVQHRSETHSNESQHLAEGTEVARLWRRFYLFYSRHFHSARVTISADKGWRLRAPDSLVRKARRLYKRIVPGVIGPEGQEGPNGVGGEIGVGDGNGDGNGDVNGHGDGEGAGAGTGTGVEVNKGAQDGNGDGSGDGAGTGTGTGVEIRRRTPDGNGNGNGDGSEGSSGDGNGAEDNGNGNKDRIGEGGREAKKRKKPRNGCKRRVGKRGDSGGKRKKCRKERVGSVAANPDILESNKEAEGVAQGTQGSSKN